MALAQSAPAELGASRRTEIAAWASAVGRTPRRSQEARE